MKILEINNLRKNWAWALVLTLFIIVAFIRSCAPNQAGDEQLKAPAAKIETEKEESPNSQYVLGHPAATPKEEYQECYVAMRDNEIALAQKGEQFKKDWMAKWEHRGDSISTSDEADWACMAVIYSLGQIHDAYLDPDSVEALTESMKGGVAGIGAVVGLLDTEKKSEQTDTVMPVIKKPTRTERRKLRDEMTTITATRRLSVTQVMPDSPAERAGIKAGDILESVDGKSITGLSLTTVITKLVRGTPGTEVKISFSRDGQQQTVSVTREKVKIHPVATRQIGNTFYVRLKDFMTTGDEAPQAQGKEPVSMVVGEMKKALQDVATAYSNGQKPTLVLDLRGNPGGMLNYAEKILQMMMHEGTLFVLHQRDGDQIAVQQKVLYEPFVQSVEWSAAEGQVEPTINVASEPREPQVLPDDVPVVVLVDEGSASASEIVAGTLQAQRPLTSVVGQVTFGKYVGQHVIPLSNNRAVKITSFTFYPGGRSIEGVGVVPDVVVDKTANSEDQPADETAQDTALDLAIAEAQTLFGKDEKRDGLANQARERNKTRNEKILEGIKSGVYAE